MSKPHQTGRTPEQEQTIPTNTEAERTVLGFFLVGGAWREDVNAHDFAAEREQVIWHAMKAIHEGGDEIDRNRLNMELGQKKLKLIGPGYLGELGEGCFPEMKITPYVARLHDAATRRDILHHTHILMTHLHSEGRTGEQLIEMGADFFITMRAKNGSKPEPAATVPQWPDPIHEDGFHGIAGEVVRIIEPHSEADAAALLVQTLIGWGSLAGRSAYYLAEADRHHANEYAVIVGTTSKGRKGTSWGRILHVLGAIDPHWSENRLLAGLGSGEALIDAVSEEDRRTLVIESEFARLLAVVSREGSTISANLRNGWDTGALAIHTRQNKVKVSGAHLSLIGHITREELLRRLDSTETANGFGNRILWTCTRRSKALPHGGGSIECGNLLVRLQDATAFARKLGNTRVQFDAKAARLWEQVYGDLSEGHPGMLGSMTSRAEAHVVRLSLIYALLDCSAVIQIEHLRAALAVWNYCAASAQFIWGDAIGDPTADQTLHALRAGADGLTRWDITNYFGRNKPASELDRAIGVLAERGLIRAEKEETGGRASTRYWSL
jgi:hypothetical protein